MFDCINRALQLKDAVTRFSENEIKLDGRADGKDDEEIADGETGKIGKEMVRRTYPHSLLFPYVLFFC